MRVRRELDEWRRELERIYQGQPRHPHAIRLAAQVERFGLSRAHFETLLAGLETDVARCRMASQAELLAYCEAVAGSLAYLCLEILGLSGATARAYGKDVAIALELANLLRDIDRDAEAGRIYLPCDRLAAHGVSESDVFARRMSPGLAAVAGELAAEARDRIARARAGLDRETRRALLVPEIWADVYLALLDELAAAGFDPFGQRPYLARRRKLALALRRFGRTQLDRSRAALARLPGRPGMW